MIKGLLAFLIYKIVSLVFMFLKLGLSVFFLFLPICGE